MLLGRLHEAERDLSVALAGEPEPLLRALLHKDLGVLAHRRRDVADAKARYTAALDAAIALGDLRLRGICTGNLGALEHDMGQFALARELYEQSLSLLR